MRFVMPERARHACVIEMNMKELRRQFIMRIAVLRGVAWLAGCGVSGDSRPPAGLNLALTQPTSGGTYVVTLVPPEPPAALPLNRIHAWRVALSRASGEPVSGARIDVAGGMPQHGHGLPTRPRVVSAGGGGYRLEGMKFSMPGWWTITLKVRAAQGDDDVTFNVVLPPAAAS
ncbi:Auxin-binding protein [Burkholderia glumae]|nr:Auxin-binding protein [Burkholderia glumae]